MGDVLVMSMLSYEQEMKDKSEFEPEVPAVDVPKAEVAMARSLVEMMSVEADDLNFGSYRNTYTDKLLQLIEAKMQGKEIVAPPAAEIPQVANLMEALQKSVAAAAKDKKQAAKAKPPVLNAPSAAGAAKRVKKRKSS
jgi:DNA end-binding protein Ku